MIFPQTKDDSFLILKYTKKYWKNSGSIILAIIIGKGFSFLWKLLLARMGSQNLGQVEILLNIITVLTMFSVIGFQTSIIRFVSIAIEKHHKEYASALFLYALKIVIPISICFSAVLFIFPEISSFILGRSSQTVNIRNIIWAIPFFAIIEMLLSLLISFKQTRQYAIGKYILQPFLRLVLLAGLLAFGISTTFAIPIHIPIAGILSSIILWGLCRKFIFPVIQMKERQQKIELIKYTIPMSGSLLLFVMYGALDSILLGRYQDIRIVGQYSVLVVMAEIISVIFSPLLNTFQSYLSIFHENRTQGFRFTIFNILLYVSGASIIGLILYAGRSLIISKVFGEEYLLNIGYFAPILGIKIIEETIILPLRHFLDFYSHVKHTFILMAGALIVKVIVGLVTVPTSGIGGIVYMQIAGTIFHLLLLITITYTITRAHHHE
jgi:O-antigen/teichoic acid export membrane protein